jgi:hypothetical protein
MKANKPFSARENTNKSGIFCLHHIEEALIAGFFYFIRQGFGSLDWVPVERQLW